MQQLVAVPVRRPDTQLEHEVTSGGTVPINHWEPLENTSLDPLVDLGCCVYLLVWYGIVFESVVWWRDI